MSCYKQLAIRKSVTQVNAFSLASTFFIQLSEINRSSNPKPIIVITFGCCW